jgi:hypothetical protein
MSFTTISTSVIATGEPTTNTFLTQVKDNFDNHESRISAVETGSTTVYAPVVFTVNGDYSSMNGVVGVVKSTMNFDLTVTGVRLLIDKAGSSGTTEVDIKFKRGVGSWTSILSTKPSVAYGSGDDSISSNAVLNPSYVDLEAGDLIRVDITSVQSHARSFNVRIDFNKT